jgi:quinol monooxygenase YgiN
MIAKPAKKLKQILQQHAVARKRNCANIMETLRIMNNDHVILNVHIEAAAGHEEKLAEQLRALVAPTRSEAGCLTYELHRDPQNSAKFMFYERFTSQSDLDQHLATPHFKKFIAYRAALNPDPVSSIVITTWRSIA